MSKNYQKSTYTMDEIGTWALSRWPDRFQDFECAKATMHYFRRQLGIVDVNGRSNYIQISASDADRLKDHVTAKYTSKAPAEPIIAPEPIPATAPELEIHAEGPGRQLTFDDIVQDQLNKAVEAAFEKYFNQLGKKLREAEAKAYEKGYREGYEKATAPTPKCVNVEVKPRGKWDI